MRRIILYMACLFACASCSREIEVAGYMGSQPEIFPDYRDVTIPSNIAPLNFEFIGDTGRADLVLLVEAPSGVRIIRPHGRLFSFRERMWSELLAETSGRGMIFRLCVRTREGWKAYDPFVMNVAKEPIDPYLAYRLIPPGYSLWKDMYICQRNLENFEEKKIYSNSQGKGNCVNCHSFCDRDPDRMLFHMRSELAGTYVWREGQLEKLETRTSQTMSSLVYPYWHPSGRYVAFSVNRTNQVLHVSDDNRIEVFDEDSDVVVYDLENHTVVTTDVLKSEDAFETFPTFSPDGKSLYFCSSKAVSPMPEKFKEARYSLCRVDFNPEDHTFGDKVDTLYNADTQRGSVSFPRVSPDGSRLVFTLSDYGNFSIWHKEADLYCVTLSNGNISELDWLNSDGVESYHSWSGNSRWMVFSSRRDDGLYTKPYIAYMDAFGMPHKPFLLPQKNPGKHYEALMYSYNIPELVSGEVGLDGRKIADYAHKEKGKQIGYIKQ